MKANYDVIVCGGGTAGTIAAIQAGRSGASTLLVEKNGMLGGTMTVGGVNAPASFFAWGKQIIGGIGWELVRDAMVAGNQEIPDPASTRDQPRPKHVSMDIGVFTALCDEAVLDAGVELLLHAMPAAVAFRDQGWDVSICTKTGLQQTRAKVLIDATGDANVVTMAGFEVIRPEVVQPATLILHCSGYDFEKLDLPALNEAAKQAIAAGELLTTDLCWDDSGPGNMLRSGGGNRNHVRAHGAETSEGRTTAEVESRRSLMRMVRFFRRQPGLEGFRVHHVCVETGIRETVVIKGKTTVTTADFESGRQFEDAVCYAFYSVDEHLNDGKGINYRLLEPGIFPTVPRGALLPVGSQFLIVAGRCLASDREAHSGLRVECPCMAMGQAAGVMAALSAQTGLDPEALLLADIHAELRRHAAVVPGEQQGG